MAPAASTPGSAATRGSSSATHSFTGRVVRGLTVIVRMPDGSKPSRIWRRLTKLRTTRPAAIISASASPISSATSVDRER